MTVPSTQEDDGDQYAASREQRTKPELDLRYDDLWKASRLLVDHPSPSASALASVKRRVQDAGLRSPNESQNGNTLPGGRLQDGLSLSPDGRYSRPSSLGQLCS